MMDNVSHMELIIDSDLQQIKVEFSEPIASITIMQTGMLTTLSLTIPVSQFVPSLSAVLTAVWSSSLDQITIPHISPKPPTTEQTES